MLTAERLRELLSYDAQTGLFTWRVSRPGRYGRVGAVAGFFDSSGHRRICLDCETYAAHRLAWLYVHGEWPVGDIDHKDTVRSNNAIDNLRPATNAENHFNMRRHRDNASGFKGVDFHRKVGRWRAVIHVGGKQSHLGYFDTAEAAHAVYVAAATEHYGEFARAG